MRLDVLVRDRSSLPKQSATDGHYEQTRPNRFDRSSVEHLS
jgi:hypothetical protein